MQLIQLILIMYLMGPVTELYMSDVEMVEPRSTLKEIATSTNQNITEPSIKEVKLTKPV
jgi:hypothetical protein